MPKKVIRHKCDFCKRSYVSNSYALKHEGICYGNPKRTPIEGEMAIFSTLPNELKMVNSYGVENSEWEEPMEKHFDLNGLFETKYLWWPKDSDGDLELGFIWCSGKWEAIEGYQAPNFSPGACWKDEVLPQREIT